MIVKHFTTNRGRVRQHGDEIEILGEGDLVGCHFLFPPAQQQIAEVLIERSQVRQETRGQQHVSYKPVQ